MFLTPEVRYELKNDDQLNFADIQCVYLRNDILSKVNLNHNLQLTVLIVLLLVLLLVLILLLLLLPVLLLLLTTAAAATTTTAAAATTITAATTTAKIIILVTTCTRSADVLYFKSMSMHSSVIIEIF